MSRRKVIFPPADYWTNPPKENNNMTEEPTPADAGDYRRAAVLTLHHRQGNTPGLSVIVDETNARGRAAHLLLALLHLHEGFIGTLRTADGVALFADWVQGMAGLDATDPAGTDLVRAATTMDMYGRKDFDGIRDTVAAAIDDNRLAYMVHQLLDLYEVGLPELSSTAGIRWIKDHIAALANEEVEDDGA